MDITPQTTPSGNIHGMPLAALTGLGDEPKAAVSSSRAAIVGARDIDSGERENLREAGVRVFSLILSVLGKRVW